MDELSRSTKLGYGLGSIAIGIKDGAFSFFLLFYYTQVLGLKGSIAGTAIMIGLIMDAITDPVMGSISDNFSSKHGRRHPFMAISALPLAISLFALFSPIKGLGQTGLFIWMTTFVVAVRVSLTVFTVPYLALGAEITSDYVERTQLSAYRTSLIWFGGIGFISLSLVTLFRKTEAYEVGQMNAAAYPVFGLFCAVIAVTAIMVCVFMTRKEIPRLIKAPSNPTPFSPKRLLNEINLALMNPTFRVILVTAVTMGMLVGTNSNLNMIVNTYFWEFTSENLALLATGVMVASVLAFIIMKVLESYDKRQVFIGSCIFSFFHNFIIILRLFDLLPPNGDPLLLKLAYLQVVYTTTLAIIQLTLLGSIICDAVDEGELITNVRQEGIYASFFSFTTKAVSGFGALIAGFIVDFIKLPAKAAPGTVDSAIIFKLGVISGPVVGGLWVLPILFMLLRRITKGHQEEVLKMINQRKNKEEIPTIQVFEPEFKKTGT